MSLPLKTVFRLAGNRSNHANAVNRPDAPEDRVFPAGPHRMERRHHASLGAPIARKKLKFIFESAYLDAPPTMKRLRMPFNLCGTGVLPPRRADKTLKYHSFLITVRFHKVAFLGE